MKSHILLCGHTLYHDKVLHGYLRKKFKLYLLSKFENRELFETILIESITLVVLEFSKMWESELKIIRGLLIKYHNLIVIVIDGNSSNEAIIKAFYYGAIDVFRKPYRRELLVERIEALLK